METRLRAFDQLSTGELYELLRLRAEIFVVEQQCIYQDLDGKDPRALHLLGFEGKKLVAYSRLFAPGEYFDEATIGRVAVTREYRGLGLGREIMEASLAAAEARFGPTPVCLSAQAYLRRFYEELGFRAEGEEYMEDNIPHIRMTKNKPIS